MYLGTLILDFVEKYYLLAHLNFSRTWILALLHLNHCAFSPYSSKYSCGWIYNTMGMDSN